MNPFNWKQKSNYITKKMRYFNYFGLSVLIAVIAFFAVSQINYNFNRNSEILLQYDYIIVGGGTAGCVIAGQLVSKTNHSVLLIEAGDYFNVFAKIPIAATFFQGTKYDWGFRTEPQVYSSFGMFNNSQSWPRGKGLGGSNQINYLVHMEPVLQDFQTWENEYNITSWNYHSLKPYFEKMFFDQIYTSNGKIKHQSFMYKNNKHLQNSELSQAFHKAVSTIPGVSATDAYSCIRNGQRWTSYDGYLKPYLRKRNLHLLLNTRVKRVLFSGKRAIGVETDSVTAPRIYIRNEVIISAGTIQSPQILMMSGIGSKEQLTALNISMVANLPDVGKNLHDHFNTPIFVSIDPPISVTADKIQSVSEIWKYFRDGEGYLSYLPMMGFARTVDNAGFILFGMGSADEAALRQIANSKPETFRKQFPLYHNSSQEGFVFLSTCLQPKSRGTITLEDTVSYPKIDPKYLENYEDVNCLRKAIRYATKIIHSPPFRALNAQIHWPELDDCGDILSDEYLECLIRFGSITGYHPGGTCQMGKVVNENLRVKNTRGLRVIDASIMPAPLTHFPNSALIAIADRAATLIINRN